MKRLLLLFMSIILFSCVEDQIEIERENVTKSDNKMEFYYKGQFYSSDYKKSDTNSLIILEDKKADDVYKKLIANDNYVLVLKDNVYTYYDNFDSFYESQGMKKPDFSYNEKDEGQMITSIGQENALIDANNQQNYFGIFQNANYGGRFYSFYFSQMSLNSNDCIDMPNLGNLSMGIPPYNTTVNMNDEVTSFRFSCPTCSWTDPIIRWWVYMFKDVNFSGPALIIALQPQFNVPNIGNPYNDEVSSIRLFYNRN